MKKMKKSLVVVPALARIARTTVASISGTVAWFTANRAVEVSTGNFTAYDENRGLDITATAGVGTAVGGTTVSAEGVLTDASYDFTNVWTDVLNGEDNKQPTEFVKAPATYLSGATTEDNKEVYYAVNWTYTIKLAKQTGTLGKAVNVFFDFTSTFVFEETDSTAKGFRIARQSGEQKFVFSNGGTSTDAKNHIVESDPTTSGKVEAWDVADANTHYYQTPRDSYTKASDGDEVSSRQDYLGTISTANEEVSVKCTAWYEGTDPNVVSEKTMSSVGATLKFYSRNAA